MVFSQGKSPWFQPFLAVHAAGRAELSPDFVIHWLRVKGQDGSALEFVFENEKKNPPLPDGMFQFTPPPGVEYVDSSQSQ